MKKLLISAFVLLCLVITARSQILRNLVFEGAGIRGIAYSGAIRELEHQNIMKDVQRVGGTSSGAITALLLSIGYSADEITDIVNSTPYKKFNDGRFFFISGISRMRNYFGWYRGDQFEKWLSRLIRAKTGNENITFRALREKGYKDLYVTGTCLNRQSPIVFSFENYPDMRVKDAVRISMSIPLYFEAVFIDDAGHVVAHPKNKDGLNVMVDGGFTVNFPIKIFDSTKYFNPSRANTFAPNFQTLGFRIDRADQILNDRAGKSLAPFEINSLKAYFGAFYNIIVENLNRQTLTKEDWQRTVSISDGDIAPRVRKLPKADLDTLVNNGAEATAGYLADKK